MIMHIEEQLRTVQLLIGDWSVVGGVGGDDSVCVHHVLTSQVGLTHFSQAEWTESKSGRCSV